MSLKLSEGSLKAIMKGDNVPNPIMQIFACKKITSNSSVTERFRIILSDGLNSTSFVLLAKHINDRVTEGLDPFTLVKLKRYMSYNSEEKDMRILLILDIEVVKPGKEVGAQIGEPTPLNDEATLLVNSAKNQTDSEISSSSNMSSANTSTVSFDQHVINPISNLTPYHSKWVMKARVTNKSNIRTWSDSKGEGILFSFDLVDESGEIHCTVFRDLVDKYYDMIQVDKIYYFSKCQLKLANKQFNSLKNDYEMTLENESIVEECPNDDGLIPRTKYDFMQIDKIGSTEVGTIVDVVGVCKSVSDLKKFTAKTTGRKLKKKEVVLVDQSKSAICLTLWGTQAETFDGNNNPVVVIKGAKVGEFGGGKNINTPWSSSMKINPDIPECHQLKRWYDNERNSIEITNISAGCGIGSFQSPWLTFDQVQEQSLGKSDCGDYYQLMGTILSISKNTVYKSCPLEECKKMVIDSENGTYRCEKCNAEYNHFKYRLLVRMNVGDWTGNQWMTLFSSEAEKIIGRPAQEVGQMLENDQEASEKIFEAANFKQFIFKCRSKMETYNNEDRLKTVAVKVDPINYEDYNAYLIEKIQQYIKSSR